MSYIENPISKIQKEKRMRVGANKMTWWVKVHVVRTDNCIWFPDSTG